MRSKLLIAALLLAVAACAGGDESAGSATEGAAGGGEADAADAGKTFPPLDYLEQIPVAYATAKAHPEILEKIPCYCPCMLYGHRSLVDCHRSQHSAACAQCLSEAVAAGQLIAEQGADDPDAIAAQVKSQNRAGIIRNQLQSSDLPGLRTDAGRAYLQVCTDCHQPAHPAMYTPDGWRPTLARMEAYAQQRGTDIPPETWNAAVEFIRAAAAQFPAGSGENYRQQISVAVQSLQETEGETANYPTDQDPVLGPEWFERMVRAYRLARDIPTDRLAAVTLEDDPDPNCRNLLACLNQGRAMVSEAAVAAVEALAAELNIGNDN